MREVALAGKLRVLLAQALFANPDILLLDEPTNNLDINTIRWLEEVLNQRNSTMIIISHDRHFLNQVKIPTWRTWTTAASRVAGHLGRLHRGVHQARERQSSANQKAKEKVQELQEFVRRSRPTSPRRQATSRAKQIEKIKIEEFKPVEPPVSVDPL